MSKTRVEVAVDGGHATITFKTDAGINVLSQSVLGLLDEALDRVGGDASLRTTTVTAEGKVFIAGADIKEMVDYTAEQARGYGKAGQAVFDKLAALPSITIAGINGAALGGGLELALACDFRIAVKSAKLGLPETSLGLVPGWSGMMRLPRLIGPSRAKRLFLSALPMTAEDGLAIGLVDEIVNAAEDLGPRVTAYARSFKRAAPQAVALAKRAVGSGDDLTAFVDCFGTENCREGIAAFLGKRPASWME